MAKQSKQTQHETSIKIERCDSYKNACKIKNCLTFYGEVLEITEYRDQTYTILL